MSGKDIKSVVSELENVQALLYERQHEKEFLEYRSDADFVEKTARLKADLGELKAPAVFSSFPKYPLDASYCEAVEKDKESKKKLLFITLAATILFLLLYVITHWNFINTLTVIGILGSGALGFFYSSSKKAYDKKKAVYDESVDRFNKTNKEFLSALGVFEEEKEACIKAAKEYSKNYSAAYESFLMEFMKKVDNETEATERIEEIEKELSENSVIVPAYYHLIGDIISNLKNGRADDYKEALNMAIRDEKEENDRRIRIEQEEQRNRLLAMQAEEERRHNQQMERQQRAHDEAVLREQKRQHDSMMRQQRQQSYEAQRQADRAASEARKQANATKQAGISKCANCANSRNCPSSMKNNGSGLTCGGYRPYGSR